MTRKTVLILGAAAVMALSASQIAQAGQCRDPWVTQAIQQVTGRAPTGNYETGDCNIYNFNGGRWNSYPELLGYVQRYYGKAVPNAASVASGARPSYAQFNNANGIVAGGGGNLIGDGGGT